MAGLFLPRNARAPMALPVVTAANAHEYKVPHPIHPTFKVLLQAILQLSAELKGKKMFVDMGIPNYDEMGKENTAETRRDIGVFQAKFDHWTVVLNWTEETRQNLPPDYIGVDFGDSSAGILGPHANIRTCWKCGLTGFRDKEQRFPCVVPGKPCPNCHNLDWWAKMVSQDDLVEAAATALQDAIPQKPYLWEGFGGRDAELRRQGIDAGAYTTHNGE